MLRALAYAVLYPLMLVANGATSSRIAATEIAPNDNRIAAGSLKNGTLTLALETRTGDWRPEGQGSRPFNNVAAFAEVGKAASTPGPLIRVAVGTDVRVSLHNTLKEPLNVIGLGTKRGIADSAVIAPGATKQFQFKATTPGTFYYAARRKLDEFGGRTLEDAQLNGLIIVDAAGAKPDPNERFMAMTWGFTINSKSKTGLGRATMAINGLSWPHTERLSYNQGDSVHWRVVNFTDVDHPMHLHGFFFRVTSHGNGVNDSLYTAAQERMAVTEVVNPFETTTLAWRADRPGNWIYHCHYAGHLSAIDAMDTEDGVTHDAMQTNHPSDRPHQMYGLVMGITVAPKGPVVASNEPARAIRIVQREKSNGAGKDPTMAYVVDGSPEASASALPIPGPTLVLERGKRVAITVVNQSQDHAAVHWHGIELESFPDGVPGWSGAGANVMQPIKPHDSLTVRWTPVRAGSFMYHSHFSEAKQMGNGLYGPIVVLEPGQRFDPETDRILFFGTDGPAVNVVFGPAPRYIMNGKAQPPPMNLKAGKTYRFRLFNLAGDSPTSVSIMDGKKAFTWRAVAKDGYPLPANQATVRKAELTFDPGEIYDYEITPTAPGELTLSFGPPASPPPPPPKPGDPPSPFAPPPPTIKVAMHVR